MSRWKKPDDEVTDQALYMRDWLETKAGEDYKSRHREYMKAWRQKNRDLFLATQKRCYDKMRLEVLQHYSGLEVPACRCCGEERLLFLQLDHTDGRGADHRRMIGMAQGMGEQKHRVNVGGNGLPYWLKKNGFPPGFQVLCANCNLGKRTNKYCPHELERGIDMDGATIPAEFYPEPLVPMPTRRGPERDRWLQSPDGRAYIEKQAAAKRGKPSPKNTRAAVPCAECGALLKRMQCEIKRSRNNEGAIRFFCNQRCAGRWKASNLTADKRASRASDQSMTTVQ